MDTTSRHESFDPLIALIFTTFGITILSPWNIWIQLTSYLSHRLQDTQYSTTFEAYISIIFQAFQIITLVIFLKYPNMVINNLLEMSMNSRIYLGLGLGLLLFATGALLPKLEISAIHYFYVLLVMVAATGITAAFLSNINALSMNYPSYSISLLNTGQGCAGLFPAFLQLFVGESSIEDGEVGVIGKFLIGIFLLISSTAGYIFLNSQNHQYIRISEQPPSTGEEESVNPIPVVEIEDSHSNSLANLSVSEIMQVFRIISYPCISIIVNFGISLSVFPAVTSNIQSLTGNPNFITLHFVCFTLADVIGKSSTLIPRFTINSPKRVFYFTCLRIIFIPLLLMCNVVFIDDGIERDNYLPLVFSDKAYMLILFLMGFTNGKIYVTKASLVRYLLYLYHSYVMKRLNMIRIRFIRL